MHLQQIVSPALPVSFSRYRLAHRVSSFSLFSPSILLRLHLCILPKSSKHGRPSVSQNILTVQFKKLLPRNMKVGFASSTPLYRFLAVASRKEAMSITTSSSNNDGLSFTTLRDRVTCEKEIKKSKFIAIASPISDDQSALSFLSQARDPRATHNCWAYKIGDQYRCNDDGEPSGTAGKPIYSAILSSGIDRVMVVVIRHFGGIKLGTGGLARAYGGVASECLRDAPTCLVKSKVLIGMEVPFDLLGSVYHQLQSFHVEDINQDYDSGKDGITIITFRVDYDRVENLENAIKSACSRQITFSKQSTFLGS